MATPHSCLAVVLGSPMAPDLEAGMYQKLPTVTLKQESIKSCLLCMSFRVLDISIV